MKVNKWVYIVLAVFLGTFGIHRAYAGETGKIIIYTLFCWTTIPTLLSLISAFRCLFILADEKGGIYV